MSEWKELKNGIWREIGINEIGVKCVVNGIAYSGCLSEV